jgi:transposase
MKHLGIDVSNQVLDVSEDRHGQRLRRQFPNHPRGHQQLIRWALKQTDQLRVCLEATGIYHLELALTLAHHPQIELMVLNPYAARRFNQARLTRAKTDAIDADGLLHYLQRMPFVPWAPPSSEVLQLQALMHRLAQLTDERTRERNRLHAAQRAGQHTRPVQQDIRAHLQQLQTRSNRLQQQALQLIETDPQLQHACQLLVSVPGIAPLTAMKLMAELQPLANHLQPRQWVAHAGLDPRPIESGSSLHSPRRISKQGNTRLRNTLFLPALCAIRHDPNVQAFYQSLLQRGKRKMQAIIAVMRKLLHAIWGMLHHQQPWDGSKFYHRAATNRT